MRKKELWSISSEWQFKSVPREPSYDAVAIWVAAASVASMMSEFNWNESFYNKLHDFVSHITRSLSLSLSPAMKIACKTWFAYTSIHFSFLSFTLNDTNMILHTLDANWFRKKVENFYLSILLWMWECICADLIRLHWNVSAAARFCSFFSAVLSLLYCRWFLCFRFGGIM